MAVPEQFGGGGIPDTVTQMIAVEGLAYGDPGITMASVWGGAAALLELGQREPAFANLFLERLDDPLPVRVGSSHRVGARHHRGFTGQ